MRSVTVRGTVDRAIEDVFDFVADSRNDERWCPLVSDVELVEGDAPGLGAVYRFRQAGPPGTGSFTAWTRTSVHERPDRVSWSNAGEGLPYLAQIELSSLGDGRTSVRHSNRVTMPNPLLQAVWFSGAQVAMRLQLRTLRSILES